MEAKKELEKGTLGVKTNSTGEVIEFVLGHNNLNDYSRWEAYKSIYIVMREGVTSRASDMTRRIKRAISLLPHTVNDITAYLRKEQIRLLEIFERYPDVDNLLYAPSFYPNRERQLANRVLDIVWCNNYLLRDWTVKKIQELPNSNWIYDDIQTWDDFWERATPRLNKYQEPLAYLLVIRWIRRQIWICEHVGIDSIGPDKKLIQLTQRQLALYYVYLHITESEPCFDLHPGGKIAAYQEVTKPHGFSWKGFQIQYNRYLSSPSLRKDVSNMEVVNKVVSMLELYPKAQACALDELKVATGKSKLDHNIRLTYP